MEDVYVVHTTTRRTLNGCLTSAMIGAAHMLLRNNTERYVLYCVDGSSLSAVISVFFNHVVDGNEQILKSVNVERIAYSLPFTIVF